MIRLDYSQPRYENLLKLYAREFGIKVKENAIELPEHVGKGTIKVLFLSNGLQAFISNYHLAQDLLLNSKKSISDFYLLRFEEMQTSSSNISHSKSAVFLSNTNRDQMFLQTAGTHVKTVAVLFDNEWLKKFLSAEQEGDVIMKYLGANISSFIYEQMDAEYHRLMNEILHITVEKKFEVLMMHNRIMLMLERFFTRLYMKMTDAHFNLKISGDDIARLKQVEAELLKDFSAPPGIVKLSKIAAMSPSKLKNSFKDMFGMPIYQYFQKHRMNKAKAMLLSKKYSVSKVGEELGFASVSNFGKAFQKSFDQLPGDLTKEN